MGGLRQGRFCFQWVAETGVGEVGSMHLNDDLDLMETGRMFGRVDGGGLGRKWGCERRLGAENFREFLIKNAMRIKK